MTTVSLGEPYASTQAVEREGERVGVQYLEPCGMTMVSLGELYASCQAVEREVERVGEQYLEACVTTMVLGERALVEFHRDDSHVIGQ